MPSSQAHHLPQQFTSFVGREQELADISQRLADPACRLLTLVGPGGIGKTRLAIQATTLTLPHFPHGTYFINLQPVSSEEHLLTAVADALKISLTSQEPHITTLKSFLSDRDILLALDNFEQLLDVAPVLGELLADTQVKILVTSRETLSLQEEWLYPLSGMTFPTQTASPEDLAAYSAVRLFIDRAKRIRPDFCPEEKAEAIIEICQIVDGMPLALELAAPWLKSMSCAEIVAEIKRNRDFLATRLRNIPERHRSLQAVFAQTWAVLPEQEQAVFQRLAVFQGGFLRDAATTIAGASLALLSSLLDKSLLRWETGDNLNGRYQIHELLRQYAEEKLSDQPEIAQETCATHARYYTDFLGKRLTDLYGGRQREAILEIDAELNNIRAAWKWAVSHKEWRQIDKALEPLNLFCDMSARHAEGLALLQMASQALAKETDLTTRPILGRLLSRYRFMQVFSPTAPAQMEADLQQSLAIAQEQNDELETAVSLLTLGAIAFYGKQDTESAYLYLTQSLALFKTNNHAFYQARTLTWIGVVSRHEGDLLRCSQESLTIARAHDNKADLLINLGNLVEVSIGAGDYVLAKSYCQEALPAARDMQFRLVSTHISTLLSLLTFLRGDLERATELVQKSVLDAHDLNNQMAISYAESICGLYEILNGQAAPGKIRCQNAAANPGNHGIGLVTAYWGLASAHFALQAYEATWQAIQTGIQHAQHENSTTMVLWLLPLTAVLLQQQGYPQRAAQLVALVQNHPQSATDWLTHWSSWQQTENALIQDTATAVAQTKSSSWDDVLSDVIDTILSEPLPEKSESPQRQPTIDTAAANQTLIDPLTNRELEVLQLIADGLSNRQIADKLVISTGTVKYYTSHIYSKLQVTSRTQAVATARDLGMIAS